MSLLTIIMLCLVVAFVVNLIRRRKARLALPVNAPLPSRTERIAEAAVLGLAVIAIVARVFATREFDQFEPRLMYVHAALALAVLAVGTMAVVVTLKGRTSAGVALVIGVFCVHSSVLSHGVWLQKVTGAGPKVELLFDLAGTNLTGADLWVNDVHLGKTPVQIDWNDFREKVPYWPTPPINLDDESNQVEVYRYQYSAKETYVTARRLSEFQMPELQHGQVTWDFPEGTYYVRIQYGDMEGLCIWPGCSVDTTPGGYRIRPRFEVVFPEREERLGRLLDQVRAANYTAWPEWYEAMETYGDDGWLAVRDAAESEPEWMNVFHTWTTWRYGLDRAKDAESAYSAFERIRAEAEQTGCYVTASPAGHAVERLAAYLAPERLVADAEQVPPRFAGQGYSTWHAYGGRQFVAVTRAEGFSPPNVSPSFCFSPGQGMLPGDLVVIHALLLMDKRLDNEQPNAPNIVEERVVPQLIRNLAPFFGHWSPQGRFELPVALGGTQIERFLLRQDWMASAEGGTKVPLIMQTHSFVNAWLYWLAHLDGEEGRRFREQNGQYILGMASDIVGRFFNYDAGRLRDIDFVFLDLERGTDSLAYRFWPTYRSQVRSLDIDALRAEWEYLARMEPLGTPEMYADAFAVSAERAHHLPWFPFEVLERLPEPRRTEIVDAVLEAAEKASLAASAEQEQLSQISHETLEKLPEPRRTQTLQAMVKASQAIPNEQEKVLDLLRKCKNPEQIEAEEMLANARAVSEPGADISRELGRFEWTHPLIAMLAVDDDANLREMAVAGIPEAPVPKNIELLRPLMNDPDSDVRAAAQDAQRALDELAATPSMTFADDPAAHSSKGLEPE